LVQNILKEVVRRGVVYAKVQAIVFGIGIATAFTQYSTYYVGNKCFFF